MERFHLALLLGCFILTGQGIVNIQAQRPPYNGPARQQGYERSQCALIIPGIGKSSSFDRLHNVNPKFNSGETCITIEAVNNAFTTAKEQLRLAPPKGKTLSDIDIDNLANVIVEATRILAKQYGLPRDAVQNGLPLIDTRKTVIDQYCPSFLKKTKCEVKRYREFNGMCNNLENPFWGATLTPFRRMLPPAYADGISEPRISVSGEELPTPRYISAYHHLDMGYHDHAVTVFLISWGQSIDHDMTFTADAKDPVTETDPVCCDVPPHSRHPNCWPIEIPSTDAFYSLFRRRCMEFTRSASSLKPGCKLGPRTQLNLITSYLDANFIYGSDKETSDKLRTFRGGLLKSTPVFREYGLKDLLPLKLENPDDGCIRATPDTYCFMAGDVRVNEQLVLAVTHTVIMREHNRIATELGQINPHWDDERIYQETRHIVAALVQQITYNEFLPMVLGKDLMQRYSLILERDGYFNGYDPKVDASMPDAFIAAAFRFGHSLLPATVERWSVSHKYIASQRLSEMLRQPYDLYKGGYCDQYISGLMNQVSQAMDDSMTQEVTNHLFQDSDKRWGLDLAALNIQRGRDHGIPSYNDFREYCGLPRANHWRELAGAFANDTLKHYSEIYNSPDDIDLWTAGVSERPLPGSMVGPVFGCIMGETFRNLRFGDRFWFENPKQPSSFTIEQMNEIRKVKLARLICDNSDAIESVQVYVMVLPDPEINPRVPCKSSVLPSIDLTKWRDTEYRPSGNLQTLDVPSDNSYDELPPETFNLFQPPENILNTFDNSPNPLTTERPKPTPFRPVSDAEFNFKPLEPPGTAGDDFKVEFHNKPVILDSPSPIDVHSNTEITFGELDRPNFGKPNLFSGNSFGTPDKIEKPTLLHESEPPPFEGSPSLDSNAFPPPPKIEMSGHLDKPFHSGDDDEATQIHDKPSSFDSHPIGEPVQHGIPNEFEKPVDYDQPPKFETPSYFDFADFDGSLKREQAPKRDKPSRFPIPEYPTGSAFGQPPKLDPTIGDFNGPFKIPVGKPQEKPSNFELPRRNPVSDLRGPPEFQTPLDFGVAPKFDMSSHFEKLSGFPVSESPLKRDPPIRVDNSVKLPRPPTDLPGPFNTDDFPSRPALFDPSPSKKEAFSPLEIQPAVRSKPISSIPRQKLNPLPRPNGARPSRPSTRSKPSHPSARSQQRSRQPTTTQSKERNVNG